MDKFNENSSFSFVQSTVGERKLVRVGCQLEVASGKIRVYLSQPHRVNTLSLAIWWMVTNCGKFQQVRSKKSRRVCWNPAPEPFLQICFAGKIFTGASTSGGLLFFYLFGLIAINGKLSARLTPLAKWKHSVGRTPIPTPRLCYLPKKTFSLRADFHFDSHSLDSNRKHI